jgi:hypothetical protein
MLFALQAPLTFHARTTLPADTDPISFFEARYCTAYSGHISDNLMTRDKGKGGYSVVVVDGVDISMTQTAVRYRNQDITCI